MKKKIRILYILTNLEVCNGVTTYVVNYFKNMNLDKFSIDFLISNNSIIDSKEIEKLLNERNSRKFCFEQIGIKNFIKANKQIKDFFKNNAKNYDIVHCHMLNNGAFFLHYAKKYGIKCRILHSHVTQSADTKLKKIRNDLLVPIAIKNATHYFACSKDAGELIFKNKEYIIINNAIDSKKFQYSIDKRKKLRKEMKLEENFVFGNIGRLCPQKNQLFLIDIFNNIRNRKKNSKLVIVGDGPLKEKIQEKIEKMNLEKDVIILESREDVQDMYQIFDLFLFPTMYEGLGIVLIEAQLSGLRCFTSNVVPVEAQITQNYKTQDINDLPEKWAQSVLKYCEEPYERKTQNEALIKHNYDIEKEVVKLEKIYEKILKESYRG